MQKPLGGKKIRQSKEMIELMAGAVTWRLYRYIKHSGWDEIQEEEPTNEKKKNRTPEETTSDDG